MNRRPIAVMITVLCALLIAGCGGTAPETPVAPALPPLPDLTGLALDRAREVTSDAGFANVDSHDAAGDRNQIVDENWHVCDQVPPAGPADPATTVALGVVRIQEACPGETSPTSSAAATTTRRTSTPPTSTYAPDTEDYEVPEYDAPDEYVPDDSGGSSGDDNDGDSGGGSAGTARSGAYCSPRGSIGTSATGRAMVCRPGSDGEDRWHNA